MKIYIHKQESHIQRLGLIRSLLFLQFHSISAFSTSVFFTYFKNQSWTITRGHTDSCSATRTVPLPPQQQLQRCSFPSAVEEEVADPVLFAVTQESREAHYTALQTEQLTPEMQNVTLLQPQPCREQELPPSWANPGKLTGQHSAP